MKILECVPNFSEGRDAGTVRAIAAAVQAVRDVRLADVNRDADHNRSVFTFLGEADNVVRAALAAAQAAFARIDLRAHQGAHPRIGAADVVPFVPLADAEMSDAVAAAHRFGREAGGRFNLPVYFYGEAALDPRRRHLPEVRRGGYEKLPERLCDPGWKPDAGPCAFNPRLGAMIVGARVPLVAFNVDLATEDLSIASNIARQIRESCGGLPAVRALGVPLRSRRLVQVSMNLTDCLATPVASAFRRIRELAGRNGVEIVESELIGLAPRAAFDGISPEELKLKDFSEASFLETHLEAFH